jgi:hypothetical protein
MRRVDDHPCTPRGGMDIISSTVPVDVVRDASITVEPETPGSVPGQAGLENGPEVNFRHFSYP